MTYRPRQKGTPTRPFIVQWGAHEVNLYQYPDGDWAARMFDPYEELGVGATKELALKRLQLKVSQRLESSETLVELLRVLLDAPLPEQI